MTKKIAVVLATAVLAAIAILGALPGLCRLERATTIAAPPDAVQERLANLQLWMTWSPWERPDPGLQRIFEGPLSGTGASYAWWSDSGETSAGRLTVLSASAGEVLIHSRVDRPRATVTDFEFRLAPDGKGTRVTWIATSGSGRVHALFDLLAGHAVASAADLEAGLFNLKSVAESAAAVQTYRVERSAKMEASPSAVLARIADVRGWTDWSPREILDRKMHEELAGPPSRPGSTYYWSGNAEVGSGRLTLISAGDDDVALEVEVMKPVPSLSDYRFMVAPDGKGARVTWTVSGEMDQAGRAFALFAVPADELGANMEKALGRLAALVQAEGKLAAK